MNLLEHHAKTLLAEHGLPVPRSWLVRPGQDAPESLDFPVVAKSQVPVGGRGKAGGIITVETMPDVAATLTTLFHLPIKGYTPSAVLLEEKLVAARELYLSLRLNRDSRQIEWLASPQGGIEIEDNAESVVTVPHGSADTLQKLADTLDVEPGRLAPLLADLERCFFQSDLLLCEINPLIELVSKELCCADAKCLVDDNARFRHPELPWPPAEGNPPKPLGGVARIIEQTRKMGVDLRELGRQNLEQGISTDTSSESSGDLASRAQPDAGLLGDTNHYIGCIANGAGMAMSTMDTIVAAGGQPANFLDIGGGTGEKEFVTALKQIMELPGVTSIIVNIFAGISRCDEIARGIIAAREQLSGLPPLFIRLEGTNRDIAVELLTEAGVSIEPDLKTCVRKAMEVRI